MFWNWNIFRRKSIYCNSKLINFFPWHSINSHSRWARRLNHVFVAIDDATRRNGLRIFLIFLGVICHCIWHNNPLEKRLWSTRIRNWLGKTRLLSGISVRTKTLSWSIYSLSKAFYGFHPPPKLFQSFLFKNTRARTNELRNFLSNPYIV